jgi:hypothetical protein
MRDVLALAFISALIPVGMMLCERRDHRLDGVPDIPLRARQVAAVNCAADPDLRECRLPMRDGPYVLVGPAGIGQ